LQLILFTTDEDILELVAANDQMFEVDAMHEELRISGDDEVHSRPSTADDRDTVSTLHGSDILLSWFYLCFY